MNRQPKSRRRSFFASIESMERREVLNGSPVLMSSGALASQPTWGQLPTFPLDISYSTSFEAATVITTDIFGQMIDFNKDGFADLIETGNANGLIGYGSNTSSAATTTRGTFGKVAFGGPNGPVFSTKGKLAIGSVPFQAQGDNYVVVDLNGDGFQDIITTRMVNSDIAGSGFTTDKWLFDPQQQTFVESPNTSAINGWTGKTGPMTIGDVTGDGLPDMINPNFSTTPVSLQGSSILAFPMIGFQVFAGVANPSTGKWAGDFGANAISTLALKQPNPEWGLPTSGSAPNYGISTPFGSIAVVKYPSGKIHGPWRAAIRIHFQAEFHLNSAEMQLVYLSSARRIWSICQTCSGCSSNQRSASNRSRSLDFGTLPNPGIISSKFFKYAHGSTPLRLQV